MWGPGWPQHSASDTVKRPPSGWPSPATAAASWLRLPLGKCLASHRLRIMAVGLGLEAKKLRWLWREGEGRSPLVAWPHPRLLPPAPQPTPLPTTLDALAAGGWATGPTECPVHPTHPTPLGWTAGGLCNPPCPSPMHLSRWSFWARVRQSAPRLQGGSRLVMIFCRMRKGILKALGPTRAGTPPSLSRASSSVNLVSWGGGGVKMTVRTFPGPSPLQPPGGAPKPP